MKHLICLLFFIPVFASAQKTHKVEAKESIYSIGRAYNIHPKELAAYNNIPLDKGLEIGQVIRIPAKGKLPLPPPPAAVSEPVKTTAAVQPKPAPTTGTVPVYHKVAKKETLYHISTLYNKVPVADIKKWNNLTGDGVKEGTDLIVGYTKQGAGETKTITPVVTPAEPRPVVKETVPVVKEEVVTTVPAPMKPEPLKAFPGETKSVTGKNFNGGFFKNIYDGQPGKKTEETGTAGIFKSTSGWEDGKYYCLHNDAPAGSVVKITNTGTGRSVYARVLDVIPDLKQNTGLLVRLSNAAADELGAGTDNFNCTINF